MPTTVFHQRYPYTGMEKLLVIGINVGTTLSGVSYALLEPGKVPRIQHVTRLSGQRAENSKSKIHSVVCYDQDGHVIATGSETDLEVNPMLPEIKDVRRAECFKSHLSSTRLFARRTRQLEKIWPPLAHAEDESDNDVPLGIERAGGFEESKESKGGRGESEEEVSFGAQIVERQHTNKRKIPHLVTDDFKAPVQVFTEYLQYLFKSAKEYITETERNLDPTFSWSSIERNAYFVLTHPHGWEGRQQSQMRDAAVAAGLVNSSTAAQIAFVAEGKAGFHFCLHKNPGLYQERDGLLVVDCGGGGSGININAYSQTEKGGFKEIPSSYCFQQGFILITSCARDYFHERFKDSHFWSDNVVAVATDRTIDNPEGVNCKFCDHNRPYFVKFGCLRDNNLKYGVSDGIFKAVEGAQQREEVARFFKLLNAQIEQASSLMADSLYYLGPPDSSKELDDVLNRLDGYIGSSLCNDLRGKSKNSNIGPDPWKAQIALQSGLVNACSYIINHGIPPSDGTLLSRAHDDMVGINSDTFKTQRHVCASPDESLDINLEYLAGTTLDLITAVGGSLESGGALPPQYSEVLEEIGEASLKLHKVFTEDMASVMELVSYTMPCDADFDPSRMEDTEGDSETGSGRVICTLEAGLQYRERDERRSGEAWHIAVKAKVVLASTLYSVQK